MLLFFYAFSASSMFLSEIWPVLEIIFIFFPEGRVTVIGMLLEDGGIRKLLGIEISPFSFMKLFVETDGNWLIGLFLCT